MSDNLNPPVTDELIDKAEAVVRSQNRAGISLVQRHLKIGYNRAAMLLEELEKRGVVSRARDGLWKILPTTAPTK